MNLEIFGVNGIGEVVEGDDVASLILDALPEPLQDFDIVVVTHKIVSKAEGALQAAATDEERRRDRRIRIHFGCQAPGRSDDLDHPAWLYLRQCRSRPVQRCARLRCTTPPRS